MAVHFQNLSDLQDPRLMKAALNAALKVKRRARFVFNPRCAAFGGPLLVVAGPGMPIAAEVKKLVKQGGGAVKGKYSIDRKGRLVFEVNKRVSPGAMSEAIRAFFLASNSNIALDNIRILTPAQQKRIAQRRKERAAAKKST
ncbi:MAG: hypothetical protein P8R54_03950 [Myxococcota bacterium]|nr:hypothetical protein [Myxococcota bacterium]